MICLPAEQHSNKTMRMAMFFMVALVLSTLAAAGVDRFFGISFTSKPLPVKEKPRKLSPAKPLPDIARIDAIRIQAGAMDNESCKRAVTRLSEAISKRTGHRPVLEDENPGSVRNGRVIAIGEETDIRFDNPGAFSFRPSKHGSLQILNVIGGSEFGKICGIHRLADEILGNENPDIFDLNLDISPALSLRLVDPGAVGIVPDPEHWGNDYKHHHGEFYDMILPRPPFVNETAFKRVESEFSEYTLRMISYGFNGIVMNGFLEYVDFDLVGNGYEIYGPDSAYRKSHRVFREKFGALYQYARDMGMKVYLRTDMLSLSDPLKDYLIKRFGGLDNQSGEFWKIYELGLEELFRKMPMVDGIVIRIGEAGSIYNPKSGKYYSELAVSSDEYVRRMLRGFIAATEKCGKKLIFRNWSVGIGEVGAMHTDPAVYERVLGDVDSSCLTVSTKYGMGDFTRYLQYNQTLVSGRHRRMVEFQARREYEAFNAFPNYLGPFHQQTIRDLMQTNPKIDGMWLWTQRGGPLRAGPMLLYPFHGFWELIDINVFITGRLAWNPDADMETLTDIWIREHFGDAPETVAAIREIMFLSGEAVAKGIYIGGFAEKRVRAVGMEPSPVVWIWDIVSGANTVLGVVYITCRDDFEKSVAEGFEAVGIVKKMKALAAKIKTEGPDQQRFRNRLAASLDYEENLFETLAWYRKTFLYYYRWLDTGDAQVRQEWIASHKIFEQKKDLHLDKYGNDFNLPAYNFFAAEAGLAHAQRSGIMIRIARALMLVSVLLLPTCFRPVDRCRLVWILLQVCCIAAGALVFSSFLSTVFPVLCLACIFILLSEFGLSYWEKGLSPAPIFGSLIIPVFLFNMFLMATLSIRGPVYFWFLFWTMPAFRMLTAFLIFMSGFLALFLFFTASASVYRKTFAQAFGNMLFAFGMMMIIIGGAIHLEKLENYLTTLNNELAVLPLCLSKILGITVNLNISQELSFHGMLAGVLLMTVGYGLRYDFQKTSSES